MAMMVDGRVRADRLHSRTVGMSELEAPMGELAAGSPTDVKVLLDPRRP